MSGFSASLPGSKSAGNHPKLPMDQAVGIIDALCPPQQGAGFPGARPSFSP